MPTYKKLRLLILLVAIVILGFSSIAVINYIKHRGLVKVNVAVVPADSHLTVDGKAAKPGGVYLKSGVHTLIASRQDFGNDKEVINTADINKGQTVYMLPPANSAAAMAYLQANPNIQQERESAGGAESARIQALLLKKNPILSKLPQETLDYKIDYSTDSNQNVSFTITTYAIVNGPSDYSNYIQQTKSFRQEAIDFLQKNGVDIKTADIKYIPSNV